MYTITVSASRSATPFLGWLDEQHTLTPSGQALCEADASQQWPLAARAFVASSVGTAWLKWSCGGRLELLDEDSAEDFLAEHCEASASTASRRARTLKSWLRALRTFDVQQVEGDAVLRDFLTGFLSDPALPTRMLNWAERHQLRTIAELVARDPAAMQGEKNLGRKSISDTDALFRSHTGRSWEQLRAEKHHGSPRHEHTAQVIVLEKLLFESMYEDPRAYTASGVLLEHLVERGITDVNENSLRSSVVAKLRDAGVLIASSPQGYKIPTRVNDLRDFVARMGALVEPVLGRVSRVRDEVRLLSDGRVELLEGHDLLRLAVDQIHKID